MGDVTEIGFTSGYRKEAIEVAVDMVRRTGRSATVIVCRDIPGKHTGGEDCFCDPKILVIEVEDVE